MYQTIQRAATAFSAIGGVGIFLMMILTTMDVGGKYFFNLPIPGAAEIIASYFMIAAVFLPLADTESRNEVIAVDLVYEKIPVAWRMACNFIAIALTFVFYGVLAWQNFGVAIDSYEIGEYVSGTWDVVIWPSKFLIPIGLFATFAVLTWRMFHLEKISFMHHEVKDPT